MSTEWARGQIMQKEDSFFSTSTTSKIVGCMALAGVALVACVVIAIVAFRTFVPVEDILKNALEDVVADVYSVEPLGALTESHTSQSGAISIRYPADWTLDEKWDRLWLGNTSDVVKRYTRIDRPAPFGSTNEVLIIIVEPAAAEATYPGISEVDSLEQALHIVTAVVDWPYTVSTQAETVTIAGHPAIMLQDGAEEFIFSQGFLAIIDFDGNFVVVWVKAQMKRYDDQALTLLNTLEVASSAGD